MICYLNIVSSLMEERNKVTRKIGDVKRFLNSKKLCSYAGLVPRTLQSGNHVYHGRILKITGS